MMTMSQIIVQEEIECQHLFALHKEMSLCEERIMHEETMICCHQQTEKESVILGSPRCLRGELDEGMEEGRIMTAIVKDLVDLEETAIRRNVTRMRMVLYGVVVGRGDAGMRKVGDSAEELADLEFETHNSRVQFLEIEADAAQAKIDVQESVGVSKPNVEPPFHTAD